MDQWRLPAEDLYASASPSALLSAHGPQPCWTQHSCFFVLFYFVFVRVFTPPLYSSDIKVVDNETHLFT